MEAHEIFEILVRENQRMLLAYLRGLISEADAHDVFQQTCLTAWQVLASYDRTRPFGPWFRGIASRLVLKHWSKHRPTVPLDEGLIETLGAKVDGLAGLPGDAWAEKMDSLRDCLSRIPEADRRLVELYYQDGLTCGEIARKWGEGVEAVKKRLQRARLALSRCLEGKLAGAIS